MGLINIINMKEGMKDITKKCKKMWGEYLSDRATFHKTMNGWGGDDSKNYAQEFTMSTFWRGVGQYRHSYENRQQRDADWESFFTPEGFGKITFIEVPKLLFSFIEQLQTSVMRFDNNWRKYKATYFVGVCYPEDVESLNYAIKIWQEAEASGEMETKTVQGYCFDHQIITYKQYLQEEEKTKSVIEFLQSHPWAAGWLGFVCDIHGTNQWVHLGDLKQVEKRFREVKYTGVLYRVWNQWDDPRQKNAFYVVLPMDYDFKNFDSYMSLDDMVRAYGLDAVNNYRAKPQESFRRI